MGKRSVKEITIPYEPNHWQELLDEGTVRNGVWVCHRGMGKSTALAARIIREVIQSPVPLSKGLYIAPYRTQARKIAWDIFKRMVDVIPGRNLNENEMRIDLPPDKTIWLLGADNPDSIRGHHPIISGLDESSDIKQDVWNKILLPASWRHKMKAIFVGTPKGKNNLFYTMFEHGTRLSKKGSKNWFVKTITADESGLIPRHVLEEAKQVMGQEAYDQEFNCAFLDAIVGSYYSKIIQELANKGRLNKKNLWIKEWPVYTGWDLGLGPNLVIWFAQLSPDKKQCHIIDYHENPSGEGLEYATSAVATKPYRYAEHYVPHDVKQPDTVTGKSRLEFLQEKLGNVRHIERLPIDDGIQAVRNLLPMCWFDESIVKDDTWHGGFEALKHYRCEWVEKRGTFKPTPFKDWSEHSADSMRCLALGISLFQATALRSFSLASYDILGQYLKEHAAFGKKDSEEDLASYDECSPSQVGE